MDAAALANLEALATQGLGPDMTFLFDLPAEVGLARAGARIAGVQASNKEARFEGKALAFHDAVRTAFLERAALFPDRFHTLDASQGVEDVAEALWHALAPRLERT